MPEDVEVAEGRGDAAPYAVLRQFKCVKILIPKTITIEPAIERTTTKVTEARNLANGVASMLSGPFSRDDLLEVEDIVRDLKNITHLIGNVNYAGAGIK